LSASFHGRGGAACVCFLHGSAWLHVFLSQRRILFDGAHSIMPEITFEKQAGRLLACLAGKGRRFRTACCNVNAS
jgi:hypothetical protein